MIDLLDSGKHRSGRAIVIPGEEHSPTKYEELYALVQTRFPRRDTHSLRLILPRIFVHDFGELDRAGFPAVALIDDVVNAVLVHVVSGQLRRAMPQA